MPPRRAFDLPPPVPLRGYARLTGESTQALLRSIRDSGCTPDFVADAVGVSRTFLALLCKGRQPMVRVYALAIEAVLRAPAPAPPEPLVFHQYQFLSPAEAQGLRDAIRASAWTPATVATALGIPRATFGSLLNSRPAMPKIHAVAVEHLLPTPPALHSFG